MKSKLLLLSFLMLLTVATTFAQTSASQAGIAVQGIARDISNTAITSKDVNFKFTIYYLSSNTTYENFTETKTLKTDAFGVFSHILNVNPDKNPDFANYQMFLKIEAGTPLVEISNEALKHVPYAIAANNGVPMGSVMAFLGDALPAGWIFCKGQTWASVGDKGLSLKAFLGNPALVPNLQGMFLRGTGTSPVNGQAGPALNVAQGDGFKEHLHDKGTISATGGEHKHLYKDKNLKNMGSDNGTDISDTDNDYNYMDDERTTPNLDGAHTHTIAGETGLKGINETRPVNHGVNYIIKL